MKTISDCINQIIRDSPFLEDALSRQILNYSALAKDLNKDVANKLNKPVKDGAIMMALRRYKPPVNLNHSFHLKRFFANLGDITVRSNLCDLTYQNSSTLALNQSKLLEEINSNKQLFYAFTRGIVESNVMISSSEKSTIVKRLKNEILIGEKDKLNAISIKLPEGNSKITGLYYQIFKRLAWENVALYEVVSTTNEFTILVEDHYVDRAFSVIKRLKES
jgi:hypothetical protein